MNINFSGMSISESDFDRLRVYMQHRYGINLSKKRALVEGRLSKPVAQAGFDNYHDYLEDVFADASGKKANELVARLTTNYTYFMREEAHYKFMRQVALPEWSQKLSSRDLRTWSAGCSTGAEAYTAAMTIDSFFGANKSSWDTTILATDISLKVLSEARQGIYPASYMENIAPEWRKKYLIDIGNDQWKINDYLAKEVIFSQFNLMGEFDRFKKRFHIIFCRNVMIYFDNPTKSALVEKFFNVLEPGGYFFIGMSETLNGIFDRFTQVMPSIYKK